MVDKINVFLKTRETALLDQKLSEAQNFDLYRATENYKAGLLLLPLWSVLLYILRFSLRNLLSQNLVHNFLTANQIWETTILRVEKTVRPITKNLPEVLGFHALSFSYPVNLLET